MEIDFNTLLIQSRIKPNITTTPQRVSFGNMTNPNDTFRSTSVNRYLTEDAIKYAIATNPRIQEILTEIDYPEQLNMKELNLLLKEHAIQTQNLVIGIIEHLPLGLKQHVNIQSLKDASYLHDVGKVLIPNNILDKNDKLNAREKEIMQLHAELGYELLKNTDIDTRTLHLIKYHHQNASHSGYPKVKSDFFADINLQILTAADKYSALTENRMYKKEYDRDTALSVIYEDVMSGNMHPFVFNSLRDYTATLEIT